MSAPAGRTWTTRTTLPSACCPHPEIWHLRTVCVRCDPNQASARHTHQPTTATTRSTR